MTIQLTAFLVSFIAIFLRGWQQKVERMGRSVCPQVITAIAKEVEAYYNKYEQTCKEANND